MFFVHFYSEGGYTLSQFPAFFYSLVVLNLTRLYTPIPSTIISSLLVAVFFFIAQYYYDGGIQPCMP